MLPATRRHLCPHCREERDFEQPLCIDGHGADCPELVCVVCATALVVGFDLGQAQAPARRGGRRMASPEAA